MEMEEEDTVLRQCPYDVIIQEEERRGRKRRE